MKRAIIMAAGALALTGCGGTPDCGSEEALGLVTDIFYRETAKKFAALGRSEGRSEIAEAIQIKPTLVKMTDYNDRTDTYSCSATLTGKRLDGTDYETQVTFEVSPSAQGGGEFIVEVYGL